MNMENLNNTYADIKRRLVIICADLEETRDRARGYEPGSACYRAAHEAEKNINDAIRSVEELLWHLNNPTDDELMI